jgi:hypothetical protein
MRIACAVLGGAGLVWVEVETYREKMRRIGRAWQHDATHDEVEPWR